MKDNKICLITGATSGIGKAAALELARQGMQIIFNARDEEKAGNIMDEIIHSTGNKDIRWYWCDLASFKSIKEFAEQVRKNHKRLDILINNAGTWRITKETTIDGIESTFEVNHLAPFLLTNLLLPIISDSGSGRIINVSSGVHYMGRIDINDPEFKDKAFRGSKAYAQSKLANILFTKELAARLQQKRITVNCLAPGWVNTGLLRYSSPVAKLSARLWARTPTRGAETTVYLATSDEVRDITGEYFYDKRIRRSASQSYDSELMKKLWELSEKYVKDYLPDI